MLEILMDCHEKELMNIDPNEVASTHYSTGLIKRGFITIQPYVTKKGKRYFAMFLSNAGRNFLSNI